MKQIFILSTFAFLFFANYVSAHVLETDGSIGAVFHVSPDDDPIAGEQSDFFFEFKDRENRFNPQNCLCEVKIYQAGNEIFSTVLATHTDEPSLNNASFSYTFPKRDVYTLEISGKPITPDSFEPFTLSYTLRVERDVMQATANTESADKFLMNPLFLGSVGIAAVVVIGMLVKKSRIKKPSA